MSKMTEHAARGKVITFYSYKGGVGRTMALANVACLLARQCSGSKGVLMVDWDLEAPGLHSFFHNRFKEGDRPLSDEKVETRPGLIELFLRLDVATRKAEKDRAKDKAKDDRDGAQTQEEAAALIKSVEPKRYILETDIPSLYLLKAGCFDERYGANVNTFRWDALHLRSPSLFGAFAEYLADHYEYVLIDSRTGVTDTSGICTTLLPEKLVVVFTPNRQSLFGLEGPLREITKYRRRSDDVRPLVIFPLPSRIELSEQELREDWWLGNPKKGIRGYKPLFQSLFKDVYGLSRCDLGEYFEKVKVQHMPRFSYGEEVSTLIEAEGDRLSLSESYKTFLDWMLNRPVPWGQDDAAAEPRPSSEPISAAEGALQSLPLERQKLAMRVLARMVQLPAPGEQKENTRLRVRVEEFDAEGQELIRELERSGAVRVSREGGKDVAELADDSLVARWVRLNDWVKEDRKFLLWRQSLRAEMARSADAEGGDALLSGGALAEAVKTLGKRPDDLNGAEKDFIRRSVRRGRQRRDNLIVAGAAALMFLVVLALVGYGWYSQRRSRDNALAAIGRYESGVRVEELDPESAIEFYTQAVELKPDFADAYRNRARAYAKRNKFDLAVADYNKAVELRPDYQDALRPQLAEAYTGLGTSLRGEKRFDESVEAYQTALGLVPDLDQQAYIYYARGLTYAAQGDRERATADYNQAIRLNPDFAEAYYTRAASLADKGAIDGYKQVIDDYTQAIKSRRDFAAAYFNRGLFYSAIEDYDAAIADFKQVVELGRNSPAAYDQLGIKEPDVYNLLGLTYSKKGDARNAINAFGKPVQLRPDFVDAYFNRASAYSDADMRDSARADLTKVLELSNDPDVQQRAQRILDRLASPTSFSDTTVTIHFIEADVDEVTSIKEQLARKGISVQLVARPESDLVSADVRYFHKEDKSNAGFVMGVVKGVLAPTNTPVNFGPVLLARFARGKNVDYGMIEVWLPSLSPSSPE
jgi:tetratricopeptide (TPR) repeat protein/cellulose biosynthesis protein BcsQ